MTKWMTTGALMMGLLVMFSTQARADANTDNDADSLTITITPNIDKGVEIDTSAVVLALGTLDLYASTQTVEPATVTILGTWAQQELNLTGSINGGWSFDTSPSTDATSGELNAIAVYALFSDTSLSVAPDGDDFADGTADAGYTGGTQRIGGLAGAGTRFEKQDTGNIDMDTMAPGDDSHLWVFLRLPDSTDTSGDQEVTLTLTAAEAP